MARRSSRTPLYEHMATSRTRGSPRPRSDQRRAPAEPAEAGDGALSRTMRIPAGYLLVAGTGVILLLVMAYIIGFKRADDSLRSEYEERFLDGAVEVDPTRLARDPLNGGMLAQGSADPAVDPDGDVEVPGGGSASRWGPVESDPRKEGYHYFVLATTNPIGAQRLAEYARSRGLETYVITGNNPSYRRVIAGPGFAQPTGAAVDRLKEKILEIGREWKGRFPGESDLSDSYLLVRSGKK